MYRFPSARQACQSFMYPDIPTYYRMYSMTIINLAKYVCDPVKDSIIEGQESGLSKKSFDFAATFSI